MVSCVCSFSPCPEQDLLSLSLPCGRWGGPSPLSSQVFSCLALAWLQKLFVKLPGVAAAVTPGMPLLAWEQPSPWQGREGTGQVTQGTLAGAARAQRVCGLAPRSSSTLQHGWHQVISPSLLPGWLCAPDC